MSLWRQVTHGARVLLRGRAADQDLSDEVQHYLDESTAAHLARGLSPEAAARAARLDIGNFPVVRDTVRASAWESIIEAALADLRYAMRRLRTDRSFTTLSVMTLALGIGAAASIFSAVKPILLEPLPYPHADRIVMISDVATGGSRVDVTFGTFRELAARTQSFDAMAVMKPWQPTLTGAAEPERLDGQRVSAQYFAALGLAPAAGRDFTAADDRQAGPNVVMLSDRLWRRRFSADPDIVGRPITLDDTAFIVIGVMPPFDNVLAPSAELWAPLQYATSYTPDSREWGHHLRMVGRLRGNVTAEKAVRELAQIARRPVPEFARVPWASLESGLIVRSLRDEITYAIRPALFAIVGAVVLVLIVACVNVAHLLLARGAERRGEFALRAALGAGRGILVRQLLTEAVLLALAGGAAALVLARAGVRLLIALSPPDLPRLAAIQVDGAVFAFAFTASAVVGLAVGIVPAVQATRSDLQAGLLEISRRTSHGHRVTRRALVVAEVALALVLLVSAGLLLRSLQRVFAIDVGFNPSHLLTMQVQESGRHFGDEAAKYRFFDQALEQAAAVPGVRGAALTSLLPLSGDLDIYGVHLVRDPDRSNDDAAMRYAVTPGYFATMGIPLRRGRLLDAHDVAGAPRVAVVSETLVSNQLGGRDPIGEQLLFGPDDGQAYTIVGVVGDVKQASIGLQQQAAIYVTPRQWHWADMLMSLVVRSDRPAAALAPEIRRAIWSVDKDQPVVRVATMDQLMERSAAERRFALTLFEAFALAALALAAVGIYGVLSGSVTERTREIGVRSALGASRAEILALVVRQGLTLTGVGVAIGVIGSTVATRALVTLLFGVSRLDPVTYVGVIVAIGAVSAAACAVPAWRAARVDPSVALRAL